MKKVDILAALHDGSMTSEEVSALDDAVMEKNAANWHDLMMLTPFEHRASCHGVGYEELAKWRYGGWPETCQICGKPIDVEREHWLARCKGGQTSFGLAHVACLPVKGEGKVHQD